jgi:hypothetical protein
MPDSHDSDRLPSGVYSSPTCPPLALLRAWQQQVLPADLASDVASHMESCALCPTLINNLEQFDRTGITSTEHSHIRRKLSLGAPPNRMTGWQWYAVASAALALVVAGVLLAVRETEHPEDAHIIPPPFFAQSVQSSPGQPPAGTPPPAPPRDASQIAKLAPPPYLVSSPTLRGGLLAMPEPSAQQLAPAFDAYIRNDYSLATERFSQLAKQFPRSGTPFLYLGITQLLINNNTEALFNLTRAEQFVSSDQKDVASWYRAIAALRARAPNAAQLLQSVCERKGSPYAQQACQFEKNP